MSVVLTSPLSDTLCKVLCMIKLGANSLCSGGRIISVASFSVGVAVLQRSR